MDEYKADTMRLINIFASLMLVNRPTCQEDEFIGK